MFADQAARQAYMGEWGEWGEYSAALGATGKLLGGEVLHGTSTATTVRVRDGKRLTTDGPFAETKEQFGGGLLYRGGQSGRGDRMGRQDSKRRPWFGRGSARDDLQ